MTGDFNKLRDQFNSQYVDAGKPTIGLAGFYGYGNYGDELFLDVWHKYLSKYFNLKILHDLELKPYFSDEFNAETLKEVSGIVIGGGDILQPWNIDPRYWNKDYLSKPVWVAGVGVPLRANAAQQEKSWILNKMLAFLEHQNVKSIHLRDQVSFNWLKERMNRIEKISWSPDIVATLKPEFFNKEDKQLEKKQLGIIVRSRKGHEETDNFEYIERFIDRSYLSGWQINIIVLGNGRTMSADYLSALRLNPKADCRIILSKSIHELTSILMQQDSLLSMKFHGTVAAMMAGIPSIVGVPTLKNREFLKHIDMQNLCIGFQSPALDNVDISTIQGPKESDILNVFEKADSAMKNLLSSILAELL